MEYTNNNEGHPVQESLNEYSQDPNGFNTSNDNQFGSRPSGQHMLVNSSLTVRMFEAPNTENVQDVPASRAESQINTRYSRYIPKHPEYLEGNARLSTYKLWPIQMKQRPQQLSDAGLFFTGYDDCVRCFTCGGQIRQWAYNDDTWTEHCRLFPLCPFAIEQKGEQFIEQLLPSGLEFENEIFQNNDGLSNGNRSYLETERLFKRRCLEEHRLLLLQMGYGETDFRKAVLHLRNLGVTEPTVGDIASVVSTVTGTPSTLEESDDYDYEMSLQENRSLKRKLFCVLCKRRSVGVLFLPCAHNKTCADCGKHLLECPICNHKIDERIKTSLPNRK